MSRIKTIEDRLLHQYWSEVGGRIYGEVPIGGQATTGNWPKGSEIRRIDAIILTNLRRGAPSPDNAITDLVKRLPQSSINLVEVKRRLNRLVIGQVIAGVDMFERQYGVRPDKVTIVCQTTDPALEWVCSRHGIHVWVAPAPQSRQSR